MCHGGDHTSFLADDSSSESCSGNGSSTLNPSTSSSTQGDSAFPEMNGNGTAAPMDFTASADDQPINLCDKLAPAHVTPSYQSDGCSADGLRSRVKYAVKTTAEVRPVLGWGWVRRVGRVSLVGAEHRLRAAARERSETRQGQGSCPRARKARCGDSRAGSLCLAGRDGQRAPCTCSCSRVASEKRTEVGSQGATVTLGRSEGSGGNPRLLSVPSIQLRQLRLHQDRGQRLPRGPDRGQGPHGRRR